MKTIITITTLSLLVAVTAVAGNNQKQSDSMAAQISVTRDAMNQVITKMKDAPASQVGSNPDFIEKAEAFNAEIENAMVVFEARLKEKILKQAAFYVDRLNAIQKSKGYSTEQKEALLRDQVGIANAIFSDLSKEYQNAIMDLYVLGLNIPKVEISFVPSGRGYYECRKLKGNDYDIRAVLKSEDSRFDGKTIWANLRVNNGYCDRDNEVGGSYINEYPSPYAYNIPEIRDFVFTNVVRNGCYSASCLALYSSHRVSYINLITTDIDKPITFSVEGTKYQLTLEPLRLLPYAATNLSNGTYYSKFNGDFLRSLVSIRERESMGLPFEISDAEYETIKRNGKIEALKAALLSSPRSVWSWDCPAQVKEIKSALCNSASGCLTGAETAALEKVINDSNLFKLQSRIECLKAR